MIKFKVTPTTGRQLQPGDLFSNRGAEYWDGVAAGTPGVPGPVAERLYVRTNFNLELSSDPDETIYKIEIEEVPS